MRKTSDQIALDGIAEILRGTEEWDASTIEWVAVVVSMTGRNVFPEEEAS